MDRRYAWLRRTLVIYHEDCGSIFPLDWGVPERLCVQFCEMTKYVTRTVCTYVLTMFVHTYMCMYIPTYICTVQYMTKYVTLTVCRCVCTDNAHTYVNTCICTVSKYTVQTTVCMSVICAYYGPYYTYVRTVCSSIFGLYSSYCTEYTLCTLYF